MAFGNTMSSAVVNIECGKHFHAVIMPRGNKRQPDKEKERGRQRESEKRAGEAIQTMTISD